MYGDLIFKVHLHLLPFCKYKIAYLHLLVKRKYKRKSRFFVNRAAIHYKGRKNVAPAADQAEPRQRPPAPAALPAGREKAADPGAGDRQLCHSRRPSPESRKVVRVKVVKVVG